MDSRSKRVLSAAEEIIRIVKMTNRDLKVEYSNILTQDAPPETVRDTRRAMIRELAGEIQEY